MIDWKAVAVEQARVLENLNEHFYFDRKVEPQESFAKCFDYGGKKLDQLNVVFTDAVNAIELSTKLIEGDVVPFPGEEARVA